MNEYVSAEMKSSSNPVGTIIDKLFGGLLAILNAMGNLSDEDKKKVEKYANENIVIIPDNIENVEQYTVNGEKQTYGFQFAIQDNKRKKRAFYVVSYYRENGTADTVTDIDVYEVKNGEPSDVRIGEHIKECKWKELFKKLLDNCILNEMARYIVDNKKDTIDKMGDIKDTSTDQYAKDRDLDKQEENTTDDYYAWEAQSDNSTKEEKFDTSGVQNAINLAGRSMIFCVSDLEDDSDSEEIEIFPVHTDYAPSITNAMMESISQYIGENYSEIEQGVTYSAKYDDNGTLVLEKHEADEEFEDARDTAYNEIINCLSLYVEDLDPEDSEYVYDLIETLRIGRDAEPSFEDDYEYEDEYDDGFDDFDEYDDGGSDYRYE